MFLNSYFLISRSGARQSAAFIRLRFAMARQAGATSWRDQWEKGQSPMADGAVGGTRNWKVP
jgi:hypothetical protein